MDKPGAALMAAEEPHALSPVENACPKRRGVLRPSDGTKALGLPSGLARSGPRGQPAGSQCLPRYLLAVTWDRHVPALNTGRPTAQKRPCHHRPVRGTMAPAPRPGGHKPGALAKGSTRVPGGTKQGKTASAVCLDGLRLRREVCVTNDAAEMARLGREAGR